MTMTCGGCGFLKVKNPLDWSQKGVGCPSAEYDGLGKVTGHEQHFSRRLFSKPIREFLRCFISCESANRMKGPFKPLFPLT